MPFNSLFRKLLKGNKDEEVLKDARVTSSIDSSNSQAKQRTAKRADTVSEGFYSGNDGLFIRRKSIDLGNIEEISIKDMQEIAKSKRENIGVFEFDLSQVGSYTPEELFNEPVRKRTVEQHNILEKIKILGQDVVEKNILKEDQESVSGKSESVSRNSESDLQDEIRQSFELQMNTLGGSLKLNEDKMKKLKRNKSSSDKNYQIDEPYQIDGSIFD